MHLVQLLIPRNDDDGQPFDHGRFDAVRIELTDQFGGLTAYDRAPATGIWKPDEGHTERDDIVVLEVMDEALDRAWWADYREKVRARFEQEELVVRAIEIERL